MQIYIGIEDLVANALIELVQKSEKREVLFSQLHNYGTKVVRLLNAEREQAVLIVSKESTYRLISDYSNFFELFSSLHGEGIRLKSDVTVEKLWKSFRGYLSVDVMMAFMNSESVKELGVAA